MFGKVCLALVVPFYLYGLSLDEAISTALKNSVELKKSSLNKDVAKNDLKEKRSANYGRVDLLASYTHYNIPRTLAPVVPSGTSPIDTTEDLLSVGVNYSVDIFNGFADISSIKASELQKNIAKNLNILTKEQIVYNVKTFYLNILSLKEQVKAQQNYVNALKKLNDDISYKVKLGRLSKLDELKSLSELNHAISKLYEIKTNEKNMRESLATLLMIDEIKDVEPLYVDMTKQYADIKDYEDELLKTKRVEVDRLKVEQQKALRDKTKSVYYPKVTFNANYVQNSGENDDDNKNAGDYNSEDVWQVGVSLKWNIFDFGKKHSMLQKSKIAYLQSNLDKDKTKRELKQLLVEALNKIDLNRVKYESAKSDVELTKETQKIEQIRYDNGVSKIDDLLVAKAKFLLAESALIDAKYKYQNGIDYLKYILEKGSK